MGKRNIQNIVAKRRFKVGDRYDLYATDTQYLLSVAIPIQGATHETICEAIVQAFTFGYEMGYRATKKRYLKRRKKKPCQRANTDKASRINVHHDN